MRGSKTSLSSSAAKLKELNRGAPHAHKLSEEIVESLERLLISVCGPESFKLPPTIQQINLLWKASHWPEGTTAVNACNHRYIWSFLNSQPPLSFLELQTSCFQS